MPAKNIAVKKRSKSELKKSVKSAAGELSDALSMVREHVALAASLLKGRGVGELERLGWVLEDTLQYLDQYEIAQLNTEGRGPEFPEVAFDDFTQEDFDLSERRLLRER